jgi:hypothetical protein
MEAERYPEYDPLGAEEVQSQLTEFTEKVIDALNKRAEKLTLDDTQKGSVETAQEYLIYKMSSLRDGLNPDAEFSGAPDTIEKWSGMLLTYMPYSKEIEEISDSVRRTADKIESDFNDLGLIHKAEVAELPVQQISE